MGSIAKRSVREQWMLPSRNVQGALVISLDFELFWGVRDHRSLDNKERHRLLAARAVIPRLLTLFREFSIHATWATVGALFAGSNDEFEAFAPVRKPVYSRPQFDAYQERLGRDESEDPFHFAPTLIAQIGRTPGQEIASHSYSHFYALEAGQTVGDFESDLASAVAVAAVKGFEIYSYVFPRNQSNLEYLAALGRSGIIAYRGTEAAAVKQHADYRSQRRPHRRLARLTDAYIDLYGPETVAWSSLQSGPCVSVGASRYLRPYHPALKPLERLRFSRIANAMRSAALNGSIFHLWFHPEDFAVYTDENLDFLAEVLDCYRVLRNTEQLMSLSMREAAEYAIRSHDIEGTRVS